MAVGLPSSLYSVHVHVDGSSTLYGRAVKFQHDCMAVDCRHPYAPAQGKGRGRGGVWGPDCEVSGPQTKGVGVTNVPWDHLSGPHTYINDVNITNEGRFRLLWGNTMVQMLLQQVVAFYLKTFSFKTVGY